MSTKRLIFDLVGQTFGRLTVVSRVPDSTGRHRTMWLCKCICGTEVTRRSDSLKDKNTKASSCHNCCRMVGATTHGNAVGGKPTPEYTIWQAMLQRCRHHKSYAGRGITVCERWQNFEAFLADMGPRPDNNHSIERKDNDKGYAPDNCVWCPSMMIQLANTRRNRYVLLDGQKVHVTEAARRLGLNPVTVSGRLNKSGWSVERAFDYRAKAFPT